MKRKLVISNVVRNLLIIGGFLAALGMTIPVQAADQKYTPVTLQTLSDALFKIGVLRYSDSLAVDEYIRIHHCGLYEQYGGDDIAWTRLREAQARELELMTPTFNDYVEIQGTIMLGAYDFASSRFEIDPESALKNTGIIDVVEYDGGSYEPCVGDQYKLFVPRAHPLHLTTRISNPLTLTSLPVNRQAGDQMVKIINSRVQNRVTRSALLVMRVHLLGPDPLSGSTEPSSLTVTGDLDEILVYDGPERNVLLYTEKFTKPEDKKKSDH